ncbi:MAG: hypothetical protein RJQ01_12600 [Microcella sp.]|uniref:hypothetical protein n=1 Tax=Microcella sp. TaxID=1913979 RepID=UPI0033157611
MSTLRHPVGPQPPQVYWRRRLVVGLGLLAVIVIIVLIIVRPGTGEPAAAPGAGDDPEVSETAEPGEGDPSTSGPTPCTPEQVQVTPVTDSNSYGPEQQPLLSLTLVNTGAAPCIMDAGSDVQEYVITSGPDRIWASTDCQDPGVAASVVLEPGEEVSTTPFPWSRTRSSPGDCDADRDPVIAGGATYRLSVSVGEFASDGDVPFLLN